MSDHLLEGQRLSAQMAASVRGNNRQTVTAPSRRVAATSQHGLLSLEEYESRRVQEIDVRPIRRGVRRPSPGCVSPYLERDV